MILDGNCSVTVLVSFLFFMNLVSPEITQLWASCLQGSILIVICHETLFQQTWKNKGATDIDQEMKILYTGDDSLMQCCLGHVLYVAYQFSSENGGGEGNDLYVDMIILFRLQVLLQIAAGHRLHNVDLFGYPAERPAEMFCSGKVEVRYMFAAQRLSSEFLRAMGMSLSCANFPLAAEKNAGVSQLYIPCSGGALMQFSCVVVLHFMQ
ncbi:hypothetical protein BS78_04G081400 [Paspalum vaginatum]|nr:hypothetical protein BS78_04G081400 [Paspalum vaginatum]